MKRRKEKEEGGREEKWWKIEPHAICMKNLQHWQKPGLSLISGYQLQYTLSALREEEFFPIKIVEISSSSKRSLKLIDDGIGFSRNFVENFVWKNFI